MPDPGDIKARIREPWLVLSPRAERTDEAFRDTWKDGIHSYLTYLRDRLTVARDLLTDRGSVFVQIGDENVHRVRALMDEVFGDGSFVLLISFQKTGGIEGSFISTTVDYVLWYARHKDIAKFRRLLTSRRAGHTSLDRYDQYQETEFVTRPLTRDEKTDESNIDPAKRFQLFPLYSDGESDGSSREFEFNGQVFSIRRGTHWKTTQTGLRRIAESGRIEKTVNTIRYKRFVGDVPMLPLTERWESTQIGTERIYVVQTAAEVIKRCILMTTDPGDLVLDPTCGSGTTAYVAEQWGRRWITIDTSRVALALARTRLMAARYPWYLLADSPEGRHKEAELTGKPPFDDPTRNDLSQGFVYERVPHIMLEQIANNSRIDDIWEKWQATLEPLRAALNVALDKSWEDWEIPREAGDPWPESAARLWAFAKATNAPGEVRKAVAAINSVLGRNYTLDTLPGAPRDAWPEEPTRLHAEWWAARIARQREIDAAIAQAADVELLYDRPYTDPGRVRVAGPFTVESLSPHRIAATDETELADDLAATEGRRQRTGAPQVDFSQIVIDYLKSAGIHQSDKSGKIDFESVTPWPGHWIGAEGRFQERDEMRRAAILIGPEYGTVSRPDLTAAAREANEAGFEMLIACAFNFDAHSSELDRLGPLPILKARMNPDLHMSDELKNTGKGNLFVIFGEPDIDIETLDTGELQVTVNGVDVYDPNTGDIRSNDVRDIAAWFIDTDYNEESFFVRQAYFLGANDPYKALKTALRAEIDEEAWSTLYRATSRPFPRPRNGVIAVKVINHFGDEVMKVYRV